MKRLKTYSGKWTRRGRGKWIVKQTVSSRDSRKRGVRFTESQPPPCWDINFTPEQARRIGAALVKAGRR